MRFAKRVCLLLALLASSGCSDDQTSGAARSGDTGLLAIEDLGCGVCHVIPGVSWPQSNVGPSLVGFGNRAFVAGVVPNNRDNVASFIQNATTYVDKGAMPPIKMTGQQASDIADYLRTLQTEADQ